MLPPRVRTDKQRLDEELLRRLYQQCQGRMVRLHEKLVEEEGLQVCYPTLTRMLRELGISTPPTTRCQRVPDEPGLEMQHDTSLYQVELAGRRVKLIASLIYLRYSKRRYLTFYRAFDRFKMKCFLHEALTFWGCAARQCIIDNTNLARLRGSGANALIVPEMEAFAREHGFVFRCHEIGHCNRKAGLIPAKAFEHERPSLVELPAHLPAPYRLHGRGTDQYGYMTFGVNHYWVPGTQRADVKVLEYGDRLKIYQAGQCLVEYPLPPEGVKNKQFSPRG